MSEVRLSEIFTNDAVQSFGDALRKALRIEEIKDYASFVELDYSETKEQLIEALKTFLRRYDSHARKLHLTRPSDTDLEKIMTLIDRVGVRLVKNAIISHALVKSEKAGE
jgi:CRISPR/Cas system-associated protein Cas5 (RAMP superfamily)